MEMFDYGNVEKRNGKSAFYTYGQEGRYCTHYVGLRNRISILSEAATFIPFKDRVVATDRFVTGVLDYVVRNAKQVVDLTRAADRQVTEWGLHPEKAPALGVRFDFDGGAADSILLEKPLPAGSPMPFGRPKELVSVKMPVFTHFKVTRTSKFPAAYLIPADQEKVVALLRKHGIVVEKLTEGWQGPAESFTVSSANVPERAFQGHKLVGLEGKFSSAQSSAPSGSYIVRTAQPLGILIFHILEPESLDGVVSWGFLNEVPAVGSVYPMRKVFTPVQAASLRVD
jgi:dipeptidyl-peptidase-4